MVVRVASLRSQTYDGSKPDPDTLETQLDKIVLRLQEMERDLDKALKFSTIEGTEILDNGGELAPRNDVVVGFREEDHPDGDGRKIFRPVLREYIQSTSEEFAEEAEEFADKAEESAGEAKEAIEELKRVIAAFQNSEIPDAILQQQNVNIPLADATDIDIQPHVDNTNPLYEAVGVNKIRFKERCFVFVEFEVQYFSPFDTADPKTIRYEGLAAQRENTDALRPPYAPRIVLNDNPDTGTIAEDDTAWLGSFRVSRGRFVNEGDTYTLDIETKNLMKLGLEINASRYGTAGVPTAGFNATEIAEIQALIDAGNFLSSEQVNNTVTQMVNTDLSAYSTTAQTLNAITRSIMTALADYFDKAATRTEIMTRITNRLTDYYTKMEADAQTDAKIRTAVNNLPAVTSPNYYTLADTAYRDTGMNGIIGMASIGLLQSTGRIVTISHASALRVVYRNIVYEQTASISANLPTSTAVTNAAVNEPGFGSTRGTAEDFRRYGSTDFVLSPENTATINLNNSWASRTAGPVAWAITGGEISRGWFDGTNKLINNERGAVSGTVAALSHGAQLQYIHVYHVFAVLSVVNSQNVISSIRISESPVELAANVHLGEVYATHNGNILGQRENAFVTGFDNSSSFKGDFAIVSNHLRFTTPGNTTFMVKGRQAIVNNMAVDVTLPTSATAGYVYFTVNADGTIRAVRLGTNRYPLYKKDWGGYYIRNDRVFMRLWGTNTFDLTSGFNAYPWQKYVPSGEIDLAFGFSSGTSGADITSINSKVSPFVNITRPHNDGRYFLNHKTGFFTGPPQLIGLVQQSTGSGVNVVYTHNGTATQTGYTGVRNGSSAGVATSVQGTLTRAGRDALQTKLDNELIG